MAYLIPIVHKLLTGERISRNDGTMAIVIAPTRELVLQIFEVLTKLVQPFPFIVPGHVIGGENRHAEKARLRKGITILVATPGRLLDHLNSSHAFKANKQSWLVLDEADRLLDMGFETELRSIIRILNKCKDPEWTRQNVLASATLTREVDSLALLSLKFPTKVGLTDENDDDEKKDDYHSHKIPDGLTQYFVQSPTKKRLVHLAADRKSVV